MVKNGARKLRRHSIRETTTELVQRYFCFHCRSSFSFRSITTRAYFTAVFIREAVKDFIAGRSPVAVIHDRKGVSVGTLSTWIHSFGNACMSPLEIGDALRFRTYNHWSRILILDAKYLNKRQLLLLAIDYGTLDIIAWVVVEAESVENYTTLVDMVEACGYTIGALISDGHPSIIALTHVPKPRLIRKGTRGYPRPGIALGKAQKQPRLTVPHQLCCIHALRDIDRYLRKLPEVERVPLRALVHDVLFAKTLSKANKFKKKLEEHAALSSPHAKRVAAWINAHWIMLTIHHTTRVGKRKIPRDTNAIENTISYVNSRLKTMKRLKTTASAVPITNLIVVNYRVKCFRNPKNCYHRGKSPLALVTGRKKKFDWMEFVKKSTA